MTTLRRQVKNMVKNYSEAEVKVRDATSNDPWGPSSTLMGEISDLTYNIVALGEVMRMIWKRLNDHGKNWRHVYKSLVLLDYLIKNGNEKVAQQCKEHIVAIQTLKDFQYMEEQKDQGASVREKAKQLVSLLRDDERLKAERAKAFKARERYAQNAMGIGSDNKMVYAAAGGASLKHATKANTSYTDPYGGAGRTASGSALSPDLEAVRPSDPNEEDLQIKLAIMLSQQEHDEEVQRKRADEAKLQIALEQSKSDGVPNGLVDLSDNLFNDSWPNVNSTSSNTSSNDLFSTKPSNQLTDPWATPSTTNKTNGTTDPWKTTTTPNPSPNITSNNPNTNPWQSDPWATKTDEFDLFSTENKTNQSNSSTNDPFGDFFGSNASNTKAPSTNPWSVSPLTDPFSPVEPLVKSSSTTNAKPPVNPTRKTPESFLGENSSLVNLENLIPTTSTRPKSTNPFSSVIPSANTSTGQLTSSQSIGQLNNPFLAQQQAQKGPTINQLQQQSMFGGLGGGVNPSTPTPPPLIPTSASGGLAQPLVPPVMMPMSFNTMNPSPAPFGQPLFPSLNATSVPSAGPTAPSATTNPFLMM